MDAFEGLTKDPKWQAACELARLMMRLHGEAAKSGKVGKSSLDALVLTARAIPRALAEAHVAGQTESRINLMREAMERCRGVESLVVEWAEGIPDTYSIVIECFMRADALREMIFLASLEEQELRQTA